MSRSKVIQTGKNAIVEYLDLDTRYSGGNGDMQAAKRDYMRHLPAVYRYRYWWEQYISVKFFLGQSIGIDENNTFQLKVYSIIKTVGATVLGGLQRSSGQTDGQTERRTWLDRLG